MISNSLMRIYHDIANKLMKIIAGFCKEEMMTKGGSKKTDFILKAVD